VDCLDDGAANHEINTSNGEIFLLGLALGVTVISV
jgi:hypothetical protein